MLPPVPTCARVEMLIRLLTGVPTETVAIALVAEPAELLTTT
jgi:hypothetical protein